MEDLNEYKRDLTLRINRLKSSLIKRKTELNEKIQTKFKELSYSEILQLRNKYSINPDNLDIFSNIMVAKEFYKIELEEIYQLDKNLTDMEIELNNVNQILK